MDLDEMRDVPALIKIAEYLASGIGAVAGPLLAPWKASREAKANRIEAQGRADALKILAESHADALQTSAKAMGDTRELLSNPRTEFQGQIDLGEMVTQKIQFQEKKKLVNQLSVVRKSIEEAGDCNVRDHEPDHDWTARFFGYIQDVSGEEMQTLWAKVLAGEVQRPGETSLRTLSTLRNLDKVTAALFGTLCSACVSPYLDGKTYLDARVPSLGEDAAKNSLRKYGLSFDNLNVLNEHGLIISDFNSWYDFRLCVGVTSGSQVVRLPFSYQGRYWVLISENQVEADKEFRLSGVALTRTGRELSRVVDLQPLEEYTQELKAFFELSGLRMSEVNMDIPDC